jgi:hypothetical protein
MTKLKPLISLVAQPHQPNIYSVYAGIMETPTHLLSEVTDSNIIVFMLYLIPPSVVPLLEPYFSFNLLQQLPKLAVAVGTCLVVAKNL